MDLKQIMKQAQDLQEKMSKAQSELEHIEVTGASGGGMVEVVMSGKGIVKKVKIDGSLVDKDEKAMLEDLVIAAFNNAKNKLEDTVSQQMQSMGISTDMFKLPIG